MTRSNFFLHSLILIAGLSPCPAQPPEPKDGQDLGARARAILESAIGMVAAAPPEFQAGALLQLGSVTASFDSARALELYEQALAASAVLPTQAGYRVKEEFQSLLCEQVARLDVARAVEILPLIQIPPSGEQDPRGAAFRAITQQYLSRKETGQALEVLERLAVGGGYPYEAVALVLKALPPGDDRRQSLFSQAQASFAQRPEAEPYDRFLRAFRKDMTLEMFQSSVRVLARAVLDGKGLPEPHSQTIVAPKGTLTLTDPRDVEVFNLLDLIAVTDPSWAKDIAASRPGLREALERYPRGRASLEASGDTVTTRGTIREGQSRADIEQRARVLAFETLKAQETMARLGKDPAAALESIAQIPTPLLQVRMIETVANVSGAKPPEEARPLLAKCVATLEKVREPDYRARAWSAIGQNAVKAQDRAFALQAFEKGLTDARAMHRKDADPDSFNQAPRSAWPSAAQFKLIFYRAARSLGADAEAMLERIPDAELGVLARIEMAGAWLNAPATPAYTQVRRAGKR